MSKWSPIDDLLQQHEQEFLLQRDRLIKLIQHYPTIGQHREELIRAFLEKHLPQKVAVGTGFIYSKNRDSRQCDILIYDHINYPVMFREGSLVVVDPAAVVGVIEIKSKLSRSTLDEAFGIIANVKSLNPNALGLVFGYDCCGAKTLQNSLQNTISNGSAHYLPDGIYGLPSMIVRRYEANINGYTLQTGECCFRHFYADLLINVPGNPGVNSGVLKREKIPQERLAFTLTY